MPAYLILLLLIGLCAYCGVIILAWVHGDEINELFEREFQEEVETHTRSPTVDCVREDPAREKEETQ